MRGGDRYLEKVLDSRPKGQGHGGRYRLRGQYTHCLSRTFRGWTLGSFGVRSPRFSTQRVPCTLPQLVDKGANSSPKHFQDSAQRKVTHSRLSASRKSGTVIRANFSSSTGRCCGGGGDATGGGPGGTGTGRDSCGGDFTSPASLTPPFTEVMDVS